MARCPHLLQPSFDTTPSIRLGSLSRTADRRGRIVRTALACIVAVSLVLPAGNAAEQLLQGDMPFERAWAEDIDTDPTPDALQREVERTSQAYSAACAHVDDVNAAIDENEQFINALETQLPDQERRAHAAAAELYKRQAHSGSLVELLLSARDFFDFLSSVEYANRFAQANVLEINRLHDLENELLGARETLDRQRVEAEAEAGKADAALQDAQVARLEAQRRADEEAQRRADEEAAAAQAARAATEAATAQEQAGGSTNVPEVEAEQSSISASSSNPVDWTQDKSAFVSGWSARIDAYLAGSPLAGQGSAFASAAWDYGVDPRWSPAIAYTESTLGRYCFASHNAWGWGSVSWSSWEEAIDAHVRGLARGYGYTISWEAAAKYCPPNTAHWYNTTLAQMNKV